MSVIVMGMEVPRVCIREDGGRSSCLMDRIWCAQQFAPERTTMGQIADEQNGKLPSWCPLVELPEKHGRLIDADALDETFSRLNDDDWKLTRGDHKRMESVLFEMPTIVEAEGE